MNPQGARASTLSARRRRAGRLLALQPFLQPFGAQGGAALLLGADAIWVCALRRQRLQPTIADVDRLRIDALCAKGVDAIKRDFRSAVRRLRPASCALIVLSDGGALPAHVQRALAMDASRALQPGGLFVWSDGENEMRGAALERASALPYVFAPLDDGEGFRRACVVFPGACDVETGAFFIVAQKDGPPDALRSFDEAFAQGFDLNILSLRRERQRDETLKRIEGHGYHTELTLQEAFQWREAYGVAAAAGPLQRRRSLFGAIADAVRRRWVEAAAARPHRAAPHEPDIAPDVALHEPIDVALAYRRLSVAATYEKSRSRDKTRPRLAYVSPLPPQQSGIADYSAQLLPALAGHYIIDAIVEDVRSVATTFAGVDAVRDAAWFRANAGRYDRVLYHIGNSQFHAFMLPLLRDHPGVVVLHDFFLGHLLQSFNGADGALWREELLASHGYAAARLQRNFPDENRARDDYPANLFVIRQAAGIIAPNRFALDLARRYYGEGASDDWAVIPHMRDLPPADAREAARRSLGVAAADFLVCCFGRLGESKQNHLVLEAWLQLSSQDDPHARLVFVGEAPESEFCARLAATIAAHAGRSYIEITGFADPTHYALHLAAADVAVQLRRKSRGESSYAVIDCMAHGLPVIVNAHGPMAELPADGVVLLQEFCAASDIAAALDRLKADAALRCAVGHRAREIVETAFTPKVASRRFFDAIEKFWMSPDGPQRLTRAALEPGPTASVRERLERARQIAQGAARRGALPRQIFVDVTALSYHDAKTGIERVMRAQLITLMDAAPKDVRIEPVRLLAEGGQWRLRLARRYADILFDLGMNASVDPPAQPRAGDIYYCPELDPERIVDMESTGFFHSLRAEGVRVAFCIYDLLPLSRPEFFPVGASARHAAWLRAALANADALICISRDVARSVEEWAACESGSRAATVAVAAIHLGADAEASAPTTGAPAQALAVDGALFARPTFLAVGTVEPRKGYFQTLRAFERLWARGVDVNLVIVGAEGWLMVEPCLRRNVPQLAKRLREHEENGSRLFWLDGASDEWLDRLYARATCLIAASEAEGFGLPLVEAARRKLPILARDIPVFREVAGMHATYFSTLRADELANEIEGWLTRELRGETPQTDAMPWLGWAEHGRRLLEFLLETSAEANEEPT